MSIVDELVRVIESEVGNTSMDKRIAKAALDHLAAKAGDARGMLPAARDIGRIGARTEPDEGESVAEWYTRIGNKVLDLCAERLAPIVGTLRVQQSAELDELIADPEERAKAVAKILRGRGIVAEAAYGKPVVNVARRTLVGELIWYPQILHGYDSDRFEDLGPRAIADAIQAEEARRAQEWAGDAQSTEGGAHG